MQKMKREKLLDLSPDLWLTVYNVLLSFSVLRVPLKIRHDMIHILPIYTFLGKEVNTQSHTQRTHAKVHVKIMRIVNPYLLLPFPFIKQEHMRLCVQYSRIIVALVFKYLRTYYSMDIAYGNWKLKLRDIFYYLAKKVVNNNKNQFVNVNGSTYGRKSKESLNFYCGIALAG